MTDTPGNAKSVFLAAIENHAPNQWAAYLDEACGDDAELRARVEKLLKAHAELGDLSSRAPVSAAVPTVDQPIAERPGTMIGRYELLQEIGKGGMGVVYMAEQREPVRRKVALKVIKPGMDTKEVVARFDAERQALAMMDHPNIAKVHDGGATESGRPYFVMDLVHGTPLTEYCDENQLTTRERLELFVQVCHAVQHAHQKGIIHRDIKPSNLMVTLHDHLAIPKIIDFGIAKATNRQLSEKAVSTGYGQMVGTPLYMSPEQAQMSGLDVDTRTDIYSLGVLLYELLTGSTPFDKERLREADLDEVRRMIREEEPPRPSARLSTLAAEAATTISTHRKTDLAKLSHVLKGELDWIVMKALEKDRSLRYQTAHELALDIRRYLSGEPVQARPQSKVYRLRKFVHRNKLALAASACVAVAILVAASFGLVAHWRWLRETEARLALQQVRLDKLDAESRAKAAETDRLEAQVNALVEEAQRLSSGVFPDFPRAVELLSEAIRHRPEEARLYLYRGSAQYESGRNEEAIADLERSLQLSPDGTSAAHWLIAKAAQELGEEEEARRHWELASKRDPESVESLVVEALATPYDERGIELLTEAIRREPFDPLLYYYRGRVSYNLVVRKTPKRLYDAAIDDLEKALRGRPKDVRIVETLCRCLVKFSFLADGGEQPLVRARQLLDAWLAVEPENTSALAALADWYLANGRPEEVIETCLRGNELAPRRPEFLFSMGWASRKMGRHEDAIEYLSQALNLNPERARAEGKSGYVAGYAGRAASHFAIGREDLALQDLAEASRCTPPKKWTFYDWYNVISAHRALGKHEEGLEWCEKYVQLAPGCSRAFFWRGTLRTDLGEREAGVADFLEALRLNPASQWAYIALLTIYLKDGQYEAALEYCDNWAQAAPDSNDPYRWRALFLLKSGRHEEALRDFGEALRRDSGDSRAYYDRGNTYVALGQYDNALADFDKASELDPEDADVPLARAYVYLEQKQYELAAGDFSRTLEHRPDDAILYRQRAEAFRNLKRYDSAMADLDRALELNPQDATAYDRRGLVYTAQGRHEEAVREYAQALKLNPQEPWTNVHIVQAYLTIGDFEKALRCCDDWIGVEPTSGEPYRLRGTVHSESGAHQAALDAFGEALKRNPKDRAAHVERGRVYAALGQPAKALADYDKALELDPKYSAVYYSRGRANAQLRRYQQALADFTRALEYNEGKSWLHYHRANAHWRLGRYEEATADCSKALQLGLNEGAFFMLQARIFTSQGRLEEALTSYLRAYELDPGEAYVRDGIVKTHAKLGDHAAAVAFCDQWVREEPDSSHPYRYRGFAHYCSGAFEKALADYELALQRDPNEYRSLFYRGQVRLAMKRYDQGHADVDRSVQLCPRSEAAAYLGTVGGLYGDMEQWDRAEAALVQAIELDAQSAGPWHLLALAQLAQADQEAYRATCDRMLRQFGRTEDPNYAELVARTGILQEGSGDGAHLLALANQAVEGRSDDPLCRSTLGAVLYRTGQMDEALTHLKAAERLAQKSDSVPPLSMIPLACFLAMAHHRQGNEEEAARWLSRASVAIDTPPIEVWPLAGELPNWSWRLVGDVLRREAESVVAAVPNDEQRPLAAPEDSGDTHSPDQREPPP